MKTFDVVCTVIIGSMITVGLNFIFRPILKWWELAAAAAAIYTVVFLAWRYINLQSK